MNISMIFDKKTSRDVLQISILVILSMVSIFLSILFGANMLSFTEVTDFFTGKDVEDYVRNIIVLVRAPRALGGFICGAGLASAGILLQTALNNPLASPSTIGVNAGAGLFVLISTLLFPMNYFAKTFAAFFGAILISLLVYAISVISGASKMTIILAGMAVTTLCNAMIDTITIVFPDSVYDKTAFYIGGLSSITYEQLLFSCVFISIGFILIIFFSKQLDILVLGDEVASSLGVSVRTIRLAIVLSASLMAGASVALAGLLGFIGLIIPHISLMLFENESRTLLPKTALLGGIFVVMSDLFSRIIYSPYEVPVGIILSFIGAPFFIYLLFSGKKRGRFL